MAFKCLAKATVSWMSLHVGKNCQTINHILITQSICRPNNYILKLFNITGSIDYLWKSKIVMAVKDNKKETDLESSTSSGEEHQESKQPEVDRSGNIVCRIFRKHCLAIKNLHHNFTRSNEKKDAPKMTRNEKLWRPVWLPYFCPFTFFCLPLCLELLFRLPSLSLSLGA